MRIWAESFPASGAPLPRPVVLSVVENFCISDVSGIGEKIEFQFCGLLAAAVFRAGCKSGKLQRPSGQYPREATLPSRKLPRLLVRVALRIRKSRFCGIHRRLLKPGSPVAGLTLIETASNRSKYGPSIVNRYPCLPSKKYSVW